MQISRRRFLALGAAAVVSGVSGCAHSGRRMASTAPAAVSPNDRIRVACIGLNGQGGHHIKQFAALPDCEIAALCDVDEQVLAQRTAQTERLTGVRPKTYRDLRDLFADGAIDAVSIAMPNHWHTLAAVWACQAGKDVYVEKPVSHTFWEGRQLVAAAGKYNRIVYAGTQRRSDPAWLRGIARLRGGVIGDVYMARGLCFKPREAIGFANPSNPPGRLDWPLWQGPAPEQPYTSLYVPYNWHWFWHYGNGDIGNQGIHQIDAALWGMDKGLPVRVYSSGGRYGEKDQGQTPNTLATTFTYADGAIMTFEVRGLATNAEAGTRIGNMFYGSGGCFVEGDEKFEFFDAKGRVIPDTAPEPTPGRGNHYANFLDAIRSRKTEDIYATALDGHLGAAHVHYANISYLLGRELRVDPATGDIPGDSEARALLTRNYRPGFEVPALT